MKSPQAVFVENEVFSAVKNMAVTKSNKKPFSVKLLPKDLMQNKHKSNMVSTIFSAFLL